MAFDFNLNIHKTSDQYSKEAIIKNMVKDQDALYTAYEMFDSVIDFKNMVLEYIGDIDYSEYIKRIGDDLEDEFDEMDGENSSDEVTGWYNLSLDEFDKIVKSGKYINDTKFLAFLTLFIDEFEIFELGVYGTFEVEVTADDPDVGYYGGAEISDSSTACVTVYDLTVPGRKKEEFKVYSVSYPKRRTVWENGKRVIKMDRSNVKNTEVGQAFESWVSVMTEHIELDESDYVYDYEPDYDDYRDRD